MKRIIALILSVIMLVLCIPSIAKGEVFVGINNVMLPLDDAMPVLSGGKWYIDYLDFTRGDLGISASYNKSLGTAVLYSWDTSLVFNVGKGTAYINDEQFNQRSFSKNGTVYVPADFVAEKFGVTFSYLSEVSTIRLRTTSGMSDSMFVYIAKSRIPDLISAYNMSKQDDSSNTSPDNQTNPNSTSRYVYITVDIKTDKNTKKILDLLDKYNLSSTLFLSKDAMKDDNLMRRACGSRHVLGIYADSITSATDANNTLFNVTKLKSRLLRYDKPVPDADTSGYRQWGFNINARALSVAQTNAQLSKRTTSVLRFDDSDLSVSRMNSIFSHIREAGYFIRTIDVMLTPVAP